MFSAITIGIWLLLLLIIFIPRITYKKENESNVLTPRTVIISTKIDIKIAAKLSIFMLGLAVVLYPIKTVEYATIITYIIFLIPALIFCICIIVRFYNIYRKHLIVEDELDDYFLVNEYTEEEDLAKVKDNLNNEDDTNDLISVIFTNVTNYCFVKFLKIYSWFKIYGQKDLDIMRGKKYYIVLYNNFHYIFNKEKYSLLDMTRLTEVNNCKYVDKSIRKKESVREANINKRIKNNIKLYYIIYCILIASSLFFSYYSFNKRSLWCVPTITFSLGWVIVSIAEIFSDISRNIKKNKFISVYYGLIIGFIIQIINVIICFVVIK